MPPTQINGNGAARTIPRSRAAEGRVASTALAGDRQKEPEGLDKLAEKMDEDYQVALARRVMEARIQSIPITFSVEGTDARGKALSEQLEELWEETLTDALACFREGRVAFEKVFGFDGVNNLSIIRKLEALPFSKTELMLEDDGSFSGILLKPKHGDNVAIPADKSWWLALDPTPLEPHGRSRYMGAPYRTWRTRQETMKLRDRFLKRFALGLGLYRGPATKEDEESGENFDNWEKVGNAWEAFRSGGMMFLDNDWDGEAEDYDEKFELLPGVEDGSPIEDAVDSQDAEQIRAFGFSEKTVTEGQSVGSFAMVKSQMSLLDAVALGILMQVAKSFQLYVIDKSVALNGTAPIKLNYPRLRESVDDWILDMVAKWLTEANLSPMVLSGAIDVGQLLGSIGLPVSDDVDARIKQVIEAEKTKATMPAGGPASPFPQRQMSLRTEPRPAVPTPDSVVDESLAELDHLYRQIADELARLHAGGTDTGALDTIVKTIRWLDADARVASRVLGMLAPFPDRLVEIFGGQRDLSIAGVDNPWTDAPQGSVWRFPWIERAMQWLEDLGIVTTGRFQQLAEQDRRSVFSAPGVDDAELLKRLKDSVADSLGRGESLQEFRQRIDDEFALDRHQTETLYRTNTHRAYVAGQEGSLNTPRMQQAFPFVLYEATADTRVRDEHWALDGMVVRRNTPEHRIMLAALADYNCRCVLVPLDDEDAEDYEISTLADIPPEVVARYAV